MRVVVEGFNEPRQHFYDVRDRLISEGRQFDEAALRTLPYDQLNLCCMGNAGEAACDLFVVRREKKARRERFISMEPEQLAKCELFLRTQGMYDDVQAAIAAFGVPWWDDLNYRQKAWAKLNCLFNHIDDPQARIYDAVGILGRASSGDLPEHVAVRYMGKLKGLAATYPTRLSDTQLRNQIEEIRDDVRDFLPEPERSICLREEIRNFRCTSDCFRVLL